MKRKLVLFICFDLVLLGVAALLLVDDRAPVRPVVPELPAQVAQQRRVTRAPEPEVVRPRKPAPVDPAVVEADVDQRLQAARQESNWPVVKELNARLKQLRRERETRAPEFLDPGELYDAQGKVRVIEIPPPDQSMMPPTLETRPETPIRLKIRPKSDR